MSSVLPGLPGPRCLRRLAVALLLVGLVVLAWLPSFKLLDGPGADQIWESFGLAQSCAVHPASLGWQGSTTPTASQGLFTLSFPGQWLLWSSCGLSRFTPLVPLQAFLLVGQLATLLLAWISCRWIGLRPGPSAIAALLMATAPCSFSRLGHLGLSVLIPVLPALAACLRLNRSLSSTFMPWQRLGLGASSCLLCLPFQDYYTVFTLLLLFVGLCVQLLHETSRSLDLRLLFMMARRGALFLSGFLILLVVLYFPKLIAAGSDGLPPLWSSPRLAAEQFRYGLLPLTWFIPAPWVPSTLEALGSAGINTGFESYFWSTGSLLIPVAWMAAIRRLAQPPLAVSPAPTGSALQDADRRFLALLLLMVTAIGLLCMTMGGLGTLFAVYVSPVLRSLNRYTVFVYGAAVLYLVSEFDIWLRHREQTR